MAKLEIRKSEVDRLRPSPRAITDGSLEPVPVKPWFRSDTLVLDVDWASARVRPAPVAECGADARDTGGHPPPGHSFTGSAIPWPQSRTVRLHGVDDTAAAEWQAANNAGVITVKPDTPTRDMLGKHLPPVVFGLVVVAVALLA